MILCYNVSNSRQGPDGVYLVADLQATERPEPMPLTGEGIEGLEPADRLDAGSRLTILEGGVKDYVLGQDSLWYKQDEGSALPRESVYDTPEEAYEAERPPQWPPMPETPPECITILRHITDETVRVGADLPGWIPALAIGRYGTAPLSIQISSGSVETRNGAYDERSGEWIWSAWEDVTSLAQDGILHFLDPDKIGEWDVEQYRATGGTIRTFYAYDPSNFNGPWIDNSAVEIAVNLPNAIVFSLRYYTAYPAMQGLQFAEIKDLGDISNQNAPTSSRGYCFSRHQSLRVVKAFNTGQATSLIGAFEGCRSLIEPGLSSLGLVTRIDYAFSGAAQLPRVPDVDYSRIVTADYCFSECSSLTVIPALRMPSCISYSKLFGDCPALIHIGELELKGSTIKGAATAPFYNDKRLTRIDKVSLTHGTNVFKLFWMCGVASIGALQIPNAQSLEGLFYQALGLKAIPPMLTSGNPLSMASMCLSCTALTDISALAGMTATSLQATFQGCTSLVVAKIGELVDTSAVSSFASLFSGCLSLQDIGEKLDTSGATNISRAFYGCSKLIRVPELDLHKVTSTSSNSGGLTYAFSQCTALQEIKALKLGLDGIAETGSYYLGGLSLNGTSSSKRSLKRLALDPGWTGGNLGTDTFSLAYNAIGHDAMGDLFESLPTLTRARSLTITGNAGADGLLESEIKIATDKGWSIVGATNIRPDEYTLTFEERDGFGFSDTEPRTTSGGGIVPALPLIAYSGTDAPEEPYELGYSDQNGLRIEEGNEISEDKTLHGAFYAPDVEPDQGEEEIS